MFCLVNDWGCFLDGNVQLAVSLRGWWCWYDSCFLHFHMWKYLEDACWLRSHSILDLQLILEHCAGLSLRKQSCLIEKERSLGCSAAVSNQSLEGPNKNKTTFISRWYISRMYAQCFSKLWPRWPLCSPWSKLPGKCLIYGPHSSNSDLMLWFTPLIKAGLNPTTCTSPSLTGPDEGTMCFWVSRSDEKLSGSLWLCQKLILSCCTSQCALFLITLTTKNQFSANNALKIGSATGRKTCLYIKSLKK